MGGKGSGGHTGDKAKFNRSKSGERYIVWDKTNERWQIHIVVNGVKKHSNIVGTLQDAVIKRDKLIDAFL